LKRSSLLFGLILLLWAPLSGQNSIEDLKKSWAQSRDVADQIKLAHLLDLQGEYQQAYQLWSSLYLTFPQENILYQVFLHQLMIGAESDMSRLNLLDPQLPGRVDLMNILEKGVWRDLPPLYSDSYNWNIPSLLLNPKISWEEKLNQQESTSPMVTFQLGVYSRKDYAQNQMKLLSSLGLNPEIQIDTLYYRVILRVSGEQQQEIQQTLSDRGVEYLILH